MCTHSKHVSVNLDFSVDVLSLLFFFFCSQTNNTDYLSHPPSIHVYNFTTACVQCGCCTEPVLVNLVLCFAHIPVLLRSTWVCIVFQSSIHKHKVKLHPQRSWVEFVI